MKVLSDTLNIVIIFLVAYIIYQIGYTKAVLDCIKMLDDWEEKQGDGLITELYIDIGEAEEE